MSALRRHWRSLAALALLALLLVAFRGPLLAWFTGAPAGPAATAATPSAASAVSHYTCPMHPSVRESHPGKCPLCGMDLVPVRSAEIGAGVVVLDDGRQQEIGIRTGVVERRPAGDPVRALGKVAFDERGLSDVTVKFQGFVRALRAAQTGQRVAHGEVLLTLYSPELYLAEQDYVAALAAQRAARQTAVPDRADYLVAAAVQKLRLWDVDDAEINRLNESGAAREEVAVRSPASGVVIEKDVVAGAAVQPGAKLYRIASLARVRVDAQVYQADLPRVRLGGRATVRLTSLPGRVLTGRVGSIAPVLDAANRTAQVRVELANLATAGGGLALLPDMVAEVELAAPARPVLVVPEGAVVFTGARTLVFVDTGGGRFQSRTVELGPRAGGSYTVLSGLAEGDRVVTSGQFLLDAQGRLAGAAGPGG